MRFPSLLGNDRLKSLFAHMPADKVGSAIILSGPDGCGKVTAACDLAAALLCTGEDRPCGVCPSCRRLKAGTNSDFELFGDGSDKAPNIDQVRDMRSRSFIRSGDSGFKVFVIANADKLNPQSQNALLKVLEEPLNTVFILTCANPMDLLQTVRSRCTVYTVEPLSEDIIAAQLNKEGAGSSQQCAEAAKLCQGSLELLPAFAGFIAVSLFRIEQVLRFGIGKASEFAEHHGARILGYFELGVIGVQAFYFRFALSLIVPATHAINNSCRVKLFDELGNSKGVKLSPALVEGYPKAD